MPFKKFNVQDEIKNKREDSEAFDKQEDIIVEPETAPKKKGNSKLVAV